MDRFGVVVYPPPDSQSPFLVVTFERSGKVSAEMSSSAVFAHDLADATEMRLAASEDCGNPSAGCPKWTRAGARAGWNNSAGVNLPSQKK
jgi:hypothetical protein